MQASFDRILSFVVAGSREGARDAVRQALDTGAPAGRILAEAMIPAMSEVGRLFEEGLYFLPEMLIAARAMKEGLVILEPLLAQAGVRTLGKVVIGTVRGDMHDIGKNLVSTMLGGAGFEIRDLGANVEPDAFVRAAGEGGVRIVAMSSLLSTTMTGMETTIDALARAGLRERVTVLVGGAPLTAEYAREIGADGYAPDASRAARLATSLLSPKRLDR